MLATLSGMTILVLAGISPLYLYNIFPIYTIPSGLESYQGVLSKASNPILVILFGIVILVRLAQS